jgi:hypothetical protein
MNIRKTRIKFAQNLGQPFDKAIDQYNLSRNILLFSIIFCLVTVFVTNKMIWLNNVDKNETEKDKDLITGIYARAKSYERADGNFSGTILLYAIRDIPYMRGTIEQGALENTLFEISLRDGAINRAFDTNADTHADKVIAETIAFGHSVNKVYNSRAITDKEQKIKAIARSTFSYPSAVLAILDDYLPILRRPHSPKYWPYFCKWIVYDHLDIGGVVSGFASEPQIVSYAAFTPYENTEERRVLLGFWYDRISMSKTLPDVINLLHKEWEEIRGHTRSTRHQSPILQFAKTGIALDAGDFLIFTPLLLFIPLLYFYVSWINVVESCEVAMLRRTTSLYPFIPLASNRSYSIFHSNKFNLVSFYTLISLPVVLLFVGIVTRYNIIHCFSLDSHRFFFAHSADILSVSVDLLSLSCFIASCIFSVKMTAKSNYSGYSTLRLAIVSTLLLVTMYSSLQYSSIIGHESAQYNALFYFFVVVCILAITHYAVMNGSTCVYALLCLLLALISIDASVFTIESVPSFSILFKRLSLFLS